jgi:hypothetical protein
MYRSIAQFGAWALARAQNRGIEILDDDEISVISNSGSDTKEAENQPNEEEKRQIEQAEPGQVGRAGDPLPRFRKHMIRQRVTRHGVTYPLPAETELPGCCMNASDIGVAKEGTVKRWLAVRKQWDSRYSAAKVKVHEKIVKDMVTGFQDFGVDEQPPPTALAGRRLIESEMVERKKTKSMGLALWSLWGPKHDELTVEREKEAEKVPETQDVAGDEGRGARSVKPEKPDPTRPDTGGRSRSRRRTVIDEHQTEQSTLEENTPVAQLIEQRKEQEAAHPGLLSPNYTPETGVAGKRPFLDGIALPFSLKKDAETASMVTLNSAVTPMGGSSRPMSPSGSRMDLAGQPETDDETRAERMLDAGSTQPIVDRLSNAGQIPQIKEPE